MKYLEDNAIYVKNRDNFIYKVTSWEEHNFDSIMVNLTLVAGWDYVNPDESNIQGFIPANNFSEDIQEETVLCFVLEESIKECLEANDFEIADANTILVYKDKDTLVNIKDIW